MKLVALLLILLITSTTGCGLRQREEELKNKEAALNQKEQELLLREKTLQIKEREDSLKTYHSDSTIQTDSLRLYNPAIIGIWNVKMTCTETSCPGSAIGDTRTEQWNISFESNTVIVKAMADDKLIRTYTGSPNNTRLGLKDQQTLDSSSTKMVVRLRLVNKTTMDGVREIFRENNCKVVYSLQMNKQ